MSPFTVIAAGTTRAPDLVEVRRAASVLFDPAQGVQIQGLPSGRWRICRGGDQEAIAKAAEWFSDDKGVYFSLNPCDPSLTRPVKASLMQSRRWLLIDCDVARSDHDQNSIDLEHEAARQTAHTVMGFLADLGWPLPLITDSGNGWHLLYRVDLPNTGHAGVLVREATHRLADQFDSEAVKIDRNVHNANRISKLPGTWACKGPHSDERPHRLAKLVFCPEGIEVVTVEQLQSLGQRSDESAETIVETEPAASPFAVQAGQTGPARYALAGLEREVAKVLLAPLHTRNNTLNEAAFNIGTMVGAGWILQQKVEADLTFAALSNGLGEQEIAGTIRSGIEAGKLKPRRMPERNGRPASTADGVTEDELIIVRASAIVPRRVEWLWPGRVPLGKLTTFAGVGGLGKTFVLCDMTARISRGLPWPDGEHAEPGQVLFISGEDDADDTLVPRLIELGADLTKVCFLATAIQDRFTLADLKTLETALEQMGPGVRFVAIDPPTAYLGGVDDHKNSELRALLAPLKSWASKRRLAVIFNTHVNKQQGSKVEAMMRVMGSVAWVNAVRAAHMFARDPENLERRLFIGMKMNLAKERKGLAYRILPTETLAKVEWLGEVDTTADEAMSHVHKRERVATEWLIGKFRERLEWPSEDLFAAARNDGLSRNAVFEAKSALNLPRARRQVNERGDVLYIWWVLPDWPLLSRNVASPGQ